MTLTDDDFDRFEFENLLADLTPRFEIPWLAIGIAAAVWVVVATVVAVMYCI
jgi:hypothetical protein